MITIKNMIISILLGVSFWIGGALFHRTAETYYSFLCLVLIPLFIGVTLYILLKDVSGKGIIFYCFVSIVTRELIIVSRLLILFFNDSQLLNYVLKAIKAFLYLGSIQMFFSIAGCFFATKIGLKKRQSC